jgi:hypothetical protein
MRRIPIRFAFLLAGVLSLTIGGVPVTPALAATPPAPLTGERLLGFPSVTVTCPGPPGNVVVAWQGTGAASGPYSGSFVEYGRAEGAHSGVGTATRVLVGFKISSPTATVYGLAWLDPSRGSSITCQGEASVAIQYAAQIQPTSGGSWSDSGTGSIDVTGNHSIAALNFEHGQPVTRRS